MDKNPAISMIGFSRNTLDALNYIRKLKALNIPIIFEKESFNNDLVIRYLDKVVVQDDGYEIIFKAGVTVEVEI